MMEKREKIGELIEKYMTAEGYVKRPKSKTHIFFHPFLLLFIKILNKGLYNILSLYSKKVIPSPFS